MKSGISLQKSWHNLWLNLYASTPTSLREYQYSNAKPKSVAL